MNIVTFLTVFSTLPSFFKNIQQRLYDDEEVSENSYLFEYLSDAMSSFDRSLNNLYIVIGSSMMASVIDPDNPEEKADRIFREFEESYREFSADFRRLFDGILKEKGRLSAELGNDWNVAELFSASLSEKGVDVKTLPEWFIRDDNPYLNNERVFYHTMTEFFKSFAKRELGVKDFSLQEIINDLSVSGVQLAGILGLTCISLMASIKVGGAGNSFD